MPGAYGPKRSAWLSGALRLAVNAGLLVLFGIYVYKQRAELSILFKTRPSDVLLLGVMYLLNNLATAAQFASLYRALDADMGVWESFGLSQVSTVLNLIVPGRIGGIARVVYMKSVYATPYSQALALLMANLVVAMVSGAFIMALTNAVVAFMGQPVPLILWAAVVAAASSVVLFWVTIPVRLTSRLGRIGRMLDLFSDGWKSLRSNRRSLIEAAIFQMLSFVTLGGVITVSYRGLGLELNPLLGVSIAVFTVFSNLVIITPGNLGIQEVIIGYLSQLSGLLFVQGVAASALMRTVQFVTAFSLAPAAWYLLFYRRSIHLTGGGE